MRKAKEPREALLLIKKYEDFLKGQHRKIMNIVRKQEEFLKKFKESDEFFSRVGLSRSNIYFRIRLHQFLCKFPILKKSTLYSSYYKSNFNLIKVTRVVAIASFDPPKKVRSVFFSQVV